MAQKTDDRASQYVFDEDEDIFEEDDRRLAAWKANATLVKVPSKRVESIPIRSIATRFHQDAIKLQRDAAKLRRAKKLLNSVPPPPSSTNPQFTFADILDVLRNHSNLGLRNNWNPSLSEEDLGHDVYLNSNKYVEELEHIRLNLQDRFVSNETTSHFSFIPAELSESAKQLQKRNGWLQSPGSRVSYLSQRKIIFSTFSNNVRTFTVDNSSKRLTFLKSNSESKITSKSHVPKRALFQSPEKQYTSNVPSSNYSTGSSGYSNMPPSNYSVPSATSTASSSSSSSLITPSRSMLSKWVASRGEVKQTSSTTPRSRDSSIKRNCSKSLIFEDHPSSDKKEKAVKKPKKLSQLHCKKMLWAVETLLKSEGVVSSDPEYKSLYSTIYRETIQVWLKKYENEPRGSASGTSDLMVSVAKKILPSVEQKLGVTCKAIKARKGVSKINFETSTSSFRNESLLSSTMNESLSTDLSPNGTISTVVDTCEGRAVQEEIVFSPEVPGVSNLCDIDAVISSLDNLAPDPGDSKYPVSNAQNVPSRSGGIINSDIPASNHHTSVNLSLSMSSHSKSESNSGSKGTVLLALNASTENLMLASSHYTHKDSAQVESIPPTEPSVSGSVICTVDAEANHVSDQSSSKLDESALLSSDLPHNLLDSQHSLSTNQNYNEESLLKNEQIIPSAPISNHGVENIVTDIQSQVCCESRENIDSGNALDETVNLSKCIVKLERCEYRVESCEALETPEQSYASSLRNRVSNVSNSSVNLDLNGCISNETEVQIPEPSCGYEVAVEDKSGKSLEGSSDLRKSKRKRNSDISSNESTPVSTTSKRRSSKRLCCNQDSDLSKLPVELHESCEKANSSLRRSGRNKLSLNNLDGKSPLVDKENQIGERSAKKRLSFDNDHQKTSKNKSDDDINVEEKPSSSKIVTSCVEEGDGRVKLVCQKEESDSSVQVQSDEMVKSGEASISREGDSNQSAENRVEGENAFDKENDSSMENISDVDTQNWSPILKLKRSSKNLWSSELKKKRISNRRRKENVENSPLSSPFLDLKGPFKYRFCKRALPGEYISAIIKGEAYSKSVKKLVKNKNITKDCVLVRTVKEGLELRIPLELFKKEVTTLGPNKFHNMVSDVIEDAVNKLESFNSNAIFSGFTTHDVNQAVITSWKMDQVLKVIETNGEMVKPLFAVYKYAVVKKSPQKVQDFYQIFVEILKTSLFLMRSSVDMDTIQVRPMKSESPKKIQLEINIPVNLVANKHKLKEGILKDLNPVYNILSC